MSEIGCFKLVHSNLNYHALGTSTDAIFLSNDRSPYANITADECHAWFHLYGFRKPARSAWNPKPRASKTDNLTKWASWVWCKLSFKRDFYAFCTFMYFLFQCIHWYKLRHDDVERVLSFTCTTLFYILKYIYIGKMAKRRRSHVFAFNMQNTTRHSTWPDTCHVTVNILYIGLLNKRVLKKERSRQSRLAEGMSKPFTNMIQFGKWYKTHIIICYGDW